MAGAASCVAMAAASKISTRLVKAANPSAIVEVSVASDSEALLLSAARNCSIALPTKHSILICRAVALLESVC